jgi:hypothetical protein
MRGTYGLLLLSSILVSSCILPAYGDLPVGEEPVGAVYIYSVTATPTEAEQVTLRNNFDNNADISGWTIGDENNPWGI